MKTQLRHRNSLAVFSLSYPFFGRHCLSHSLLYCSIEKTGSFFLSKRKKWKLCWTLVHFCSPTNQMAGQKRERERELQRAGNPAILVQFLPPNLLYFISVIFPYSKSFPRGLRYNTGTTSCCLSVPGSNRTQTKTRAGVFSCLSSSFESKQAK